MVIPEYFVTLQRKKTYMATIMTEGIQSTPMAPYIGIMREMTTREKRTVMAFLIDSMEENHDRIMFDKYLEEWKRDTRFLSSIKEITSNPSFIEIVNMGGNAVPFILEEIERKPSNLVWALNAIFHKKIGRGNTITEACKLWITELKK